MQNPNSVMSTLAVTDIVARDNFTKLNHIFNGEFDSQTGVIAASLINLKATAMPYPYVYARVGAMICLGFSNISATKAAATNPTLAAPLPSFLRPRLALNAPYQALNNSVYSSSFVTIGTDGVVTFGFLPAAWTAATVTTLYQFSVFYVGV